jgi:hypothetical protein
VLLWARVLYVVFEFLVSAVEESLVFDSAMTFSGNFVPSAFSVPESSVRVLHYSMSWPQSTVLL